MLEEYWKFPRPLHGDPRKGVLTINYGTALRSLFLTAPGGFEEALRAVKSSELLVWCRIITPSTALL